MDFLSEKIKNRDVLILCSGNSILRYQDKILSYIKDNDLIVVGCNRILESFVPDYHLFTDINAFKGFSSFINRDVLLVLNSNFKDEEIKELWSMPYEKLLMDPDWVAHNSATLSEDIIYKPLEYKDGRIYGPFETVGTISIFWAHLKGARKIKIVGMDGYGYYSEQDLSEGKISQYCYGKGHIWGKLLDEVKGQPLKKIIDSYTIIDEISNRALKSLKDYGIDFEIITPTIFKEYYNEKELEKENNE
jgi:hypothetical protein